VVEVFVTVCDVQNTHQQSVVVVVSIVVMHSALAANGIIESMPKLRAPIANFFRINVALRRGYNEERIFTTR
jgi:hypothetical protein